MNLLGKVFHMLRVITGLADATESHITPSHGWLLAEPAEARRQRRVFDTDRAGRLRERGGQA
jgi:hypothetical protein